MSWLAPRPGMIGIRPAVLLILRLGWHALTIRKGVESRVDTICTPFPMIRACHRLVLMCLWLMITVPIAAADTPAASLETGFAQHVKPFLKQHCERCHNADKQTSGVRVDQLDANFPDRHLKLWEGIRRQIDERAMPPADEPQPKDAERQSMIDWIGLGLEIARSRPTPKNGSARRLTVMQYRNTLRELLLLDDELADILPPDAVSKDGFVNNQETLALSPLLIEAYLEIAERALDRCLVDPQSKPTIQNFRVDLGAAINAEPCRDKLILGADSLLLNNEDFIVSQLTAQKPFAFEPYVMQTKFRFIEGYQGNDTVRGWRDFDSIYHAVFACMRGSHGYPKGRAFSTVPEGLLLRPAIPSAEVFGLESTYGPRANFKISLRELPDEGRFRVTVKAAKYDDGLLLDPGTKPEPADASKTIVLSTPSTTPQEVAIKQPGIYRVDVHLADAASKAVAVDASRLHEGLIGRWLFDGDAEGVQGATADSPALVTKPPHLVGRLIDGAKYVDAPFGRAISLDGQNDAVVVPRHDSMNVGEGEFTVAAWIHPTELRQAGIVCLGKYAWTHGWYFDMPNNQGVLRVETVRPSNQPNGTVQSPPGAIRVNQWQHVAAVVRREGKGETQLFVNGYPVAKGTIGAWNLDNPKVDLHIGRIQDAQQFRGEIDDVRFFRRALGEAELQALVEPGRRFATPPLPEKPQELTLNLGERQFLGTRNQPAFLAVRLKEGSLPVTARYAGATLVDRIEFVSLAPDDELAKRFATFEKRSPQLGVHLGLRRDCGSTLAPVGAPQAVPATELATFVFEGAIRNFPSPDVEKDNVNYLAGIREIGVRSEYTDGRDRPRLLIRSVEFEGPFYDDWPPATHRNIFGAAARGDDPVTSARQIIRSFASRAFRRPITAAEEDSLLAIFQQSFAEKPRFESSIKDVLQVVLTSPQFLFLTEVSTTPDPEPLDDYELASKLSYFLGNGPPDAQLLDLAAKGSLHRELDAQVTRLIADARFERFVAEFGSQWLTLDKFAVLEPDRSRFPKLTRDARTQLKQEPIQFLQYLIRENLPVRQLIESDVVVANEVVASYYGLGDQAESGFQFLPIAHAKPELGGVLSQVAIMAGLSDGRESNPVKRGAWLARRIIAEPPDDPPPNVPMLKDDPSLPLRARIERHRNQPGCVQCHSKVDPWGIPFEEFDAGGRFKPEPVDARSTLPDKTEVAGFHELRQYLANDRIDQVAFSVLKHLTVYATGRHLSHNELAELQKQAVKLRSNNYRMQDMIRFVITSDVFLKK